MPWFILYAIAKYSRLGNYFSSLFFFNYYFLFYLFCLPVCLWTMCIPGTHRGQTIWCLWNWSYRGLWADMQSLGTESSSLIRAASTLNLWAICPGLGHVVLKQQITIAHNSGASSILEVLAHFGVCWGPLCFRAGLLSFCYCETERKLGTLISFKQPEPPWLYGYTKSPH